MNDQELNRMLGRIGKACFVTYFREFDNSSLPNKDVIEILMRETDYTKTLVRLAQAARAKSSRKGALRTP